MKKRFVVLKLENHVLVFDTHTNRVERSAYSKHQNSFIKDCLEGFNNNPAIALDYHWLPAVMKEMTAYYRQHGKI